MATPLTRILRAAARSPEDPLNILLVGATHERYESMMARCPHNFYMLGGPSIKPWDRRFAEMPSNYTQLDGSLGPNQIPLDIGIDLVVSQSRNTQYGYARQFAEASNCPMVSVEHVLPNPHWGEARFLEKSALRGNLNVYISEYSRDAWRDPEGVIIEHAVDAELFRPNMVKSLVVLAVVNRWKERDAECGYYFWEEATHDLPTTIVGDNPGISQPPPSTEALARCYGDALIFANTAAVSPIPMSLIEAMAAGCAIVTRTNAMLSTVIEDGVNGFLADTPEAFRAKLIELLEDPAKAATMGQRARETAISRFDLNRFRRQWDEVFRKAASLTLTGEWW